MTPPAPRRRCCWIPASTYHEACRLLWLGHSQRSVAKQLGLSKGIVWKFAKGLK